MRRRAAVAPVLLAALAGAPAPVSGSGLSPQAIRQAEALRDAALAGSGAWELLRSLTVTASPRFAGTPGDRAGVEWGLGEPANLDQNVAAYAAAAYLAAETELDFGPLPAEPRP